MSLLKQPYLLASGLPFGSTSQKVKEKAIRPEQIQDFIELRPYEIWCSIFKHLSLGDYFQCIGVCRAWYDYMIHWPEFWEQFARIPDVNRLSVDTLIRRQTTEFRLCGPVYHTEVSSMDDAVIMSILSFLPYSNNYNMTKLTFKDINMSVCIMYTLADVLQLLGSSIDFIEFIDCDLPGRDVISPILESCSKMAHVSFSRSSPTTKYYTLDRPGWKSIVNPAFSFTSLTYLKLCVDHHYRSNGAFIDNNRLSGILRKCPNLIHLFLDSGGSVHQGHCMLQAIKHCPRLRTLAASTKAEMPDTVIPVNLSDIKQHTSKVAKGLTKYVLSGGRLQIDSDDIFYVYKAAHKSLELLYLHYGAGYDAICGGLFVKLARWPARCLREIRISTESGADGLRNDQKPTVTAGLAALFTNCPVLEVARIEDTFSTGYNSLRGRLDVDDQVLKALADNCPLLRHLTIIGRRCHTNTGILYFAKTGGKALSYFEIDTYRRNLWTLVKNLGCLKTLHVRKDSLYHHDKIESRDSQAVKRLLEERGGSLFLPAAECPELSKDIYDNEDKDNKSSVFEL